MLAADLKIVWEEGFYPEEDQAIEAVVAAYEQETGKDVELTIYSQDDVFGENARRARFRRSARSRSRPWTPAVTCRNGPSDGVLADLSDVVAPIEDSSFRASRHRPTARRPTGRTAYYAVPIEQFGHYIHVWKSLLDQAGIGVEQIPREWDAFWAFWCDTVQPAVRQATGRDDIYGIGLPMSADASDTMTGLDQFRDAYGVHICPQRANAARRSGVKDKVVEILTDYTTVWRKGCTPPDSAAWTNIDNNKAFHDQRVVMTINSTLSISNALQAKRPDDYYQNTVTVPWRNGPDGKPFPIETGFIRVVVFKMPRTSRRQGFPALSVEPRTSRRVSRGLARPRAPAMPALLDTPFWQDSKDPHRTAAVSQLGQPVAPSYPALNPKYGQVDEEAVWEKAVHRIVADGLTPEQAADEAIARVNVDSGRVADFAGAPTPARPGLTAGVRRWAARNFE